MKLQKKITAMVSSIILVMLSLLTIFSMAQITIKIREKTEEGLIDMAITLSYNPIIIEHVATPQGLVFLNQYIDKIRNSTDVAFIIVTDMNKIRYSHPNEEYVAHPFSNDNIDRAIQTGEIYTEEGVGPLGRTVKAFAPIYLNGKQVGVVIVGVLKENLIKEYAKYMVTLMPVIFGLLVAGYLIAKRLAQNIKQTIYGLEPEEIAMLLNEREVILNHITDGLIAINNQGRISVINETARTILNLTEQVLNEKVTVLNENIVMIFNDVLTHETQLFNFEQTLDNEIKVISNYSVIKDKNQVVGAILTFKPITEFEMLIQELAITKNLNFDLRAQNHEFMNKLHTISGLIYLEEYEQALQFITTITNQRNDVLMSLEQIKEVSIAALLLGKYSTACESKVKMNINPNCTLTTLPQGVCSVSLVTLIGNLIQNAIEAVKDQVAGEIYVSITEDEKLTILVSNNGPKMEQGEIDAIFEAGYSTKGMNRGFGLSNINQIVTEANGNIFVESDEEETVWIIEF
ncbi:MAG: ATP-binding protein [Turicibacter sp.]